MIDPLIHLGFFAVYVIAVGTTVVFPTARRWARRRRERADLRDTIVRRLTSADGPVGPEEASRAKYRIEALIPCRIREAGKLSRRGFICCAIDGLTVLAGGDVVRSVGYGQWRRLALSDSYRRRSFEVVLEDSEQTLSIEVSRADDLVRLVNVAGNHSIAVGYLRA
jgi:hypothetical protein